MVSCCPPLPSPARTPAVAFAAVAAPCQCGKIGAAAAAACPCGTPDRPAVSAWRQRRAAVGIVAALPPPEVWHLAPMVLAEQGVPVAAIAFEAFCSQSTTFVQRRRGGGGGGGGGTGRRRSGGGRDGFVPSPPPQRDGGEVVIHKGWELF
eukprot:TRINITY_DN2396_c0_g1_i2.p3 TRINITY_DN2396_c0_g1~~TRINITY_DN2396_c0_g1_i2.p3  ORF type:complete len:150 (-),score=40.92 TRINITY_DN2396_c0_g1_i2:150-599(-)